MSNLHSESIVIDGLIIANWSRAVFEDMRKGGLTAANCTVSVWDDFKSTVHNIADMKRHIRDNADLLSLVRTTADIDQAKKDGKTGIILGFQNAHAFEDHLGHVEAFWDMGVRVVQLCYNTQNLIGTGCYERDGGLSGYGREVIAEMNRVGIMVDLSHVGAKTSEEAILASKKPVTYSHCLPAGLKEHPRNKSDEQLKFIADHGGFIGVTMFPPFLKRGIESTVDDYVEAIDYVINIAGEDVVGFGTDFTQGYDQTFFDHITHDKGRNRRLTNFGTVLNPLGIRTIGDTPNLTTAMEKAGWKPSRIEKVIGQNWKRVFADVWGSLNMGAPQLPISVDETTGIWTTDGLPMIYVPRHFFVNNHVEAEAAIGREAYADGLYKGGYRSAYFWCEQEAKTHGLKGLDVYEHYLKRLSQRGWGLFSFASVDAQTGHAYITLEHSVFVLAQGIAGVPVSKDKSCYLFAGWLSGAMDWVAQDMGLDYKTTSTETQCAAEGHDHCVFTVQPL